MEKGIIPGNLHFQTPNPDIDFDGMHLSVVSKTIPWPTCDIKVSTIKYIDQKNKCKQYNQID